jgi:hypothetical protein
MNMWAGLVVERNNLPCVGQPRSSFYTEEPGIDDDAPDEPHPSSKFKIGDIVAGWELIAYNRGHKNAHGKYLSAWKCRCTCGCDTVRFASGTNMSRNPPRAPRCDRKVRHHG